MSDKVLFMAVDGVLNSHSWWDAVNVAQGKPVNTPVTITDTVMFDPIAVNRVNKLRADDVRVVLIGEARHRINFKAIMQRARFQLPFHDMWRTSPYMTVKNRELEIVDWLKKHPKVISAAVLDNNASAYKVLAPIVVKTNPMEGVQLKDLDDVRLLMNGILPPNAPTPMLYHELAASLG